MRIAVIAKNYGLWQSFKDVIDNECDFFHVSSVGDAESYHTFDFYICLKCWRDIPNAEAVLCAVKERCK